MITSGKTTVYDRSIDFDTVVHYDLLEVGSGRVQAFLYDNNYHYLGSHEFSALTFLKCPDYWILAYYEQLSSGLDIEGDGWTIPQDSPIVRALRELGESAESSSTDSLISQPEKGGNTT